MQECDAAKDEQRKRTTARVFGRGPSGPWTRCVGLLAGVCVLAAVSVAIAGGSVAAGSTPASRHALERTIHASKKCPLNEPGAVAVDAATGVVYVVEREKHHIERFSSTGECLSVFGGSAAEYVVVDNSPGPSSGDVYAATASEAGSEERNQVRKFDAEGKLLHVLHRFRLNPGSKPPEPAEFEELGERGEILGLGVDAKGGLWVYEPETIYGFADDETSSYTAKVETFGSCASLPGFAVAPDADFFYVGRDREHHNESCEEPQEVPAIVKVGVDGEAASEVPYNAQLDSGPVHGVAVDPVDGTVFFDDGTSVSAFDTEGRFVERFGEKKPEALLDGTGIAVDGATDEVFVADGATQSVDVYGPAEAVEPPAREPELPRLPDGRQWELVTPSQKLGSAIRPASGTGGVVEAAEDGSAITYESSAPIVEDPADNRAPEPSVNLSRHEHGGWSTQDLATPRARAVAYSPGPGTTEYRYFSSDLSSGFVTQEGGIFAPDEPPLSPTPAETTLYRRDLTAPAGGCEPIPSTCYEPLVSSLNTTASGYGDRLRFLDATSDGDHAIFLTEVPIALNAEATEGEQPLYEWSQGAHGGSLQVVSVPPPDEPGGAANAVLGEEDVTTSENKETGENMRHAVSDDGSRVVWSSEGRVYVRDTVKHETLRIDVPEAGVAAPESPEAVFRIADAKGDRIFFTDERPLTKDSTSEQNAEVPREGESDLYVCEIVEREGRLACALEDLTTTVAAPGESAAVLQVVGASEDGTYVYFVADGDLAPGAGRGHCDIVTKLEEESKHVAPQSCNLYVVHLGPKGWEAPRFIAALTSLDRPDWEAANAINGVTSRVSQDGQHLAFMSGSSLTGYDNIDAVSGARDQEVFVYDYGDGQITCASCNPSGARPDGVLDQKQSGEGIGLVVDPSFIWEGQWLAGEISGWTSNVGEYGIHLPRNLSDSGRLFFNSADALVPADTNGKMDVYEYEPQGVGGCASATGCVALISSGTAAHESAFMDAGVGGGDAFIYTSAALQPVLDHDEAFDVYDAHICSEALPCSSPKPVQEAPCDSEAACRPPAASEAATLPPVPTVQPGPGNRGVLTYRTETPKPLPAVKRPTRRQLLERALKACKAKRKSRRAACEHAARAKYGAGRKGRSAKGSKSHHRLGMRRSP